MPTSTEATAAATDAAEAQLQDQSQAQSVPSAPPRGASREEIRLDKRVSFYVDGELLIVKDKAFAKRQHTKVLGVPIGSSPSEYPIPLYNVLWLEVRDNNLVLDFAILNKKRTRTERLIYPLNDIPAWTITPWVEEIMAKAYGPAQRRKRAKVLLNPNAGPGGADKVWEQEVKPVFEAAQMTLDLTRTEYGGQAMELCEQLDIDAYDVIIACAGDGMPYEIFNGLGKRKDAGRALRQIAVAHIPCGSGNAMSCNLNGTHRPGQAGLAIVKGLRTPMDLISITQGDRRTLSFLSQSVGIVAESDLGTEHLRWMGPRRFDVGVMSRVFTKRIYPCEISVKVEVEKKESVTAHYKRVQSQSSLKNTLNAATPSVTTAESSSTRTDNCEGLPPLKYGTINDKLPADWETTTHPELGNFYCGNMAYMAPRANFFAASCPNDGLMDMAMNDGTIGTLKYMDLIGQVESGGFFHNPLVSYRKVSAYRIVPQQSKGYISIDGERVPFEPFQAEIHQGLATVLSKSGKYEADGPLGWENAQLLEDEHEDMTDNVSSGRDTDGISGRETDTTSGQDTTEAEPNGEESGTNGTSSCARCAQGDTLSSSQLKALEEAMANPLVSSEGKKKSDNDLQDTHIDQA